MEGTHDISSILSAKANHTWVLTSEVKYTPPPTCLEGEQAMSVSGSQNTKRLLRMREAVESGEQPKDCRHVLAFENSVTDQLGDLWQETMSVE